MKLCLLLKLLLFLICSGAAGAGEAIFDLMRLPVGKSVTIPKPATTHVPINERVHLGATDLPQSVSFRLIANGSVAPTQTVKLAIYDPDSERVRYVQVHPGTPFVYPMRKLERILVIPQQPTQKVKLQVESNKPLEIAR